MNIPRTIVVYSAMHTGTWFTVEMLTTALEAWIPEDKIKGIRDMLLPKELKVLARSDNTINEYTEYEVIELFPTTKINEEWIKDMLKDVPKQVFEGLNLLVLQAHHLRGRDQYMYKLLIEVKPEIPIAIPIRDPLLAVHTFIRRYYSTIQSFQKASEEDRIKDVDTHIGAIADLLCSIPSEHVFLFPIDTPKLQDEHFRIKQCTDLLNYYNLTPTDKTIERAKSWKPINSTMNYFKDRNIDKSKDGFEGIKSRIIAKDKKSVEAIYNIEINYLKQQKCLKEKFKELGYENLLWW